MSNTGPRSLLAQLGSVGRPAGSAAESEARRICTEFLANAGFSVREAPFTFSAFPGMWGIPVAGAVLFAAAAIAAAGILAAGDQPGRALLISLSLVVAVGIGSSWLGRRGTRVIPAMRRSGVNLEARRGVPGVWLVAHLDSKSQPVSLLVRSIAVKIVTGSWLCVAALWLVRASSATFAELATMLMLAAAGCAALASVPLVVSWIGDRSDGALDNASGVAAILSAALRIDADIPLGVLVTSAEEFGLAGARAWAGAGAAPAGIAINCDGVDDSGVLTVTASGRGARLWAALLRSGSATTFGARFRRSLPGVLLDSTALADCGWTACTISQGTRRSLARIHTRRDTLAALSGDGVERIADVLASLAGSIIALNAGSSGGSGLGNGGFGTEWTNND